jgi:hypothetical protein
MARAARRRGRGVECLEPRHSAPALFEPASTWCWVSLSELIRPKLATGRAGSRKGASRSWVVDSTFYSALAPWARDGKAPEDWRSPRRWRAGLWPLNLTRPPKRPQSYQKPVLAEQRLGAPKPDPPTLKLPPWLKLWRDKTARQAGSRLVKHSQGSVGWYADIHFTK